MIALALSAVFVAVLAGPAAAGPVPTTVCEIQRFIGVENVKECETGS
jgi:hypothetical protein